ncbi:MAG: hypothetical protein A2651_01060 [Candidatus Yanofskybacteria bacterium RIFCSPHIGHO2_01_FULL_42_12]|uniref:Uncharacterized protein n=1 Tax=Candidatus Yanofskybacteria bacterium RIFCSPLOWO2_01_FULL_42_49 TaxID=1802694 RepID=A0A1F8GB14_9BACT|nr:MAG: hypothetical protein A2651_01060 [Candidatus Yanofskybacteria bacterium RIFCSPHIGHO2_01_FULL_42_12]OGN22574.1 MAG: hypothetical protein A2918_02320 [Candidatus Yanofskybacteria bacterium RIFCSPLOWO2_01_FULL_42_49]
MGKLELNISQSFQIKTERGLTASLHLAAGAATGVAIQKYLSLDASLPERAFCAFVAGLLSHIFLDAFPHQEYSSGGRVLWAFILGETGLVFALVLIPVDNFVAGTIIFFWDGWRRLTRCFGIAVYLFFQATMACRFKCYLSPWRSRHGAVKL